MPTPDIARTIPMRRPQDFTPAVQRWSAAFPAEVERMVVAFFGVQSAEPERLADSSFFDWLQQALQRTDGPLTLDHARFEDEAGYHNHVATAYWLDMDSFAAWSESDVVAAWWRDPRRLSEKTGYWREILMVPLTRLETLYWRDFPGGLMQSSAVPIVPTENSGYYGAMRDRIPLAATDALHSPLGDKLREPLQRHSFGQRCIVTAPENLAVIRSATFWGNCDDEQKQDFFDNLRGPLERGMAFLRENPEATGCCALRYMQTTCIDGTPRPETHAHGYFLSLAHLENWAEGHASHHAIFSGALARYKKYGAKNQLRTWHEVFVLPENGQHFEYVNCHGRTGLLPYFEAKLLDR